jgi:hypothetical protein
MPSTRSPFSWFALLALAAFFSTAASAQSTTVYKVAGYTANLSPSYSDDCSNTGFQIIATQSTDHGNPAKGPDSLGTATIFFSQSIYYGCPGGPSWTFGNLTIDNLPAGSFAMSGNVANGTATLNLSGTLDAFFILPDGSFSSGTMPFTVNASLASTGTATQSLQHNTQFYPNLVIKTDTNSKVANAIVTGTASVNGVSWPVGSGATLAKNDSGTITITSNH